jgi:hypothetical protein
MCGVRYDRDADSTTKALSRVEALENYQRFMTDGGMDQFNITRLGPCHIKINLKGVR